MSKRYVVLACFVLLAGCAMPVEGVKTEADPKVAEIAWEQQRLSMRMDEMTQVLLDIRGKLDVRQGAGSAAPSEAAAAASPVAEPVTVVEAKPEPPPAPVAPEPEPPPVVQVAPEPVPQPAPVVQVVPEPVLVAEPEAATTGGAPEKGDGKTVEAEGEQVAKLIDPPERKGPFELPAGNDPASSLFRRAYDFYLAGDFGRAILDFEEFTLNNPNHEYSDGAQFLIGDSYFQSGQFEQSIVEYNRVVERFPGGRKAPEALYMIGECFERLGQGERSKAFYVRLTEQYPSSEAARLAGRKLTNP